MLKDDESDPGSYRETSLFSLKEIQSFNCSLENEADFKKVQNKCFVIFSQSNKKIMKAYSLKVTREVRLSSDEK